MLMYLVYILSFCCVSHSASSHWIITEEGKINTQDGSPYDLHQSFNLVALLEQEKRIVRLHHLHQTLLHQKHEFQEIADLDGFFIDNPIVTPNDCMPIKNLWSHDLSISTVMSLVEKDINHDDYLDAAPNTQESEPHCYHFSKLPHHISALEHLEMIMSSDILTGGPESTLLAPFYLQIHEFGRSVHQALERNSTSWVIYNLATIYWRVVGDPAEAIECIKRLFHYAPQSHHDMPLLHLSNIFHRGNLIHEALTPLKTAISLSPHSGVLYYTLGKIYVSLGFLSQALRAFETALHYEYRYDHTLSLVHSLLCEMRTQDIVHDNNKKIRDSYKRLEEFYELLADIFHHQISHNPIVLDQWINLIYATSYQFKFEHSWIHRTQSYTRSETHSGVHTFSEAFHNILEAIMNELSLLEEKQDDNEEDLENDLNDVLVNEKFTISAKLTNQITEKSLTTPTLIKPTNVISHAVETIRTSSSSTDSLSVCLYNEYWVTTCDITTPTPIILSHDQPMTSKLNQDRSSNRKSKYTEAYRQMEFISYNSLSPPLEELIFSSSSSSSSSLPEYNDPYWPNKKQCLDLVEDSSESLPRFTGTFLTPEARGIKFQELFISSPSSSSLYEPNCVDITPLSFSMSSLDHLEGVANRRVLKGNNVSSETGLRQLLINTVDEATGTMHTFTEAADIIYHSMKQHKHHWGLYSLASVYWRALGDGYNSIECLRRSIDYANYQDKDIGYIGLANVLHRHGYLENAIITARAALDIRPNSPVGHYTLAGIYLTCGDLVATNLHLRIVLLHQPNFKHALSALKLVRCSLKFKQEQKLLEQKQHLLLAQQELMKEGRETTAENLQEVLQNIKQKETKKEAMYPTQLAGEDAIKYLTKTAVAWKEKEISDIKKEENITSDEVLPTHSVELNLSHDESHDNTNDKPSTIAKKPKYTMEYMAKENEREEELRKKWPQNLPWPSLDECKRKPPPQYMVFTSTWLSVTAKKINITDYMDFNSSLEDFSLLPFCEINFELSEITLNHFEGMSEPPLLDYIAEKGLEEVLCKLSGSYYSMEEMATRMKQAMIKNESNWVISNLAALYWRIVGNGQQAIKCLKHSLYHAPINHRDVAYVSLANVLYRSGYYENAASSMQLALETSPNLVVNHFTMANILAAQGYYREAAGYYELVLYHQPEFGPASDRLRSVRCMIILGENKLRLKDLHEEKQQTNK